MGASRAHKEGPGPGTEAGEEETEDPAPQREGVHLEARKQEGSIQPG